MSLSAPIGRTAATSLVDAAGPPPLPRPLIGITADVNADRCAVGHGYGRMVVQAGGLPIILPPHAETLPEVVRLCAGFILTGGDDPVMEEFGCPTHPRARPIHPQRQHFELELLRRLDAAPRQPVLGVCLGMQLMALHRGGTLDQHLPDTLATHEAHWGKREHAVTGELGEGIVQSHHRQAITDPGRMRIVARAHDGVIEAVADDSDGRFWLGAQWHPERTADPRFGLHLFERLVEAARSAAARTGA